MTVDSNQQRNLQNHETAGLTKSTVMNQSTDLITNGTTEQAIELTTDKSLNLT